MLRFYDIHVQIKQEYGYSVFVKGHFSTEEEALKYAVDNNLFTENGDEKFVDYVSETNLQDYLDATQEKIKLKAVNIMWDTDGNKKLFKMLPKEIEIPEGMTDDDEISDYLSDVTGYCHEGFRLIENEVQTSLDDTIAMARDAATGNKNNTEKKIENER